MTFRFDDDIRGRPARGRVEASGLHTILTEAQIVRLEEVFELVEASALAPGPAPRTDVFAALESLGDKAKSLSRAAAALAPPAHGQVLTEAALRLQQGLFDAGERDPLVALRDAMALSDRVARGVDQALAALPANRSQRQISSYPVMLVFRALQQGWGDSWIVAEDTDAPRRAIADLPIAPPFEFGEAPGSKARLGKVLQAVSDQIEARRGVAWPYPNALNRFRQEQGARNKAVRPSLEKFQ